MNSAQIVSICISCFLVTLGGFAIGWMIAEVYKRLTRGRF